MKVLFVCSGNSPSGVSPIIKSQGESLEKVGVDIEYFVIHGKGILGYLRNVPKLKKIINNKKYDLIHGHYSLSAIVASFASGSLPLIVSLMGSDVHLNFVIQCVTKFFIRTKWGDVIVKSKNMKREINNPNLLVIPNGVNLNQFYTIEKEIAQKFLYWDNQLKHILFAGDPDRKEKNYSLAKSAFKRFRNKGLCLHYIKNVPHADMVLWYNASDLVLLTSLYEGSPNVIKEAMACNCPIVATDVGDVRWLLGDLEGHYITSFDSEDVAEKIRLALDYGKRTTGRQRIIELGLDSDSVAKRIIDVYHSVLNKYETKHYS